MKRLFSVIAFATLVAMCLVACNQNEVKLHQDVGTVYGTPHGDMGGDGIVFYVDESAGYALICSMNDLQYDRQKDETRDYAWEKNFTWSVFGTDTVMERDTVWCRLKRDIRHFVGKVYIDDSILPNTIVPNEPEKFVKYNFDTTRDSVITIYPMLRYKAYKEKGAQILEGYTEKDVPVLNFGFIGELIEADTILKNVRVEQFFDTAWKDSVAVGNDTVIVGGQKYKIAVGDKFEKDKSVTLYRPYADTVERRTRTFDYIAVGYSDTLANGVRKGDSKYPNSNNWEYELDTNWSFSLVPGLGEDDPDGKVNTQKIVKADVPCRQKVSPDSSSAARACYTYYTNNYYKSRAQYAKDTLYKGSQGEWYLPSREELKKLFDAKNKVNDLNTGTKGFEPLENCYWSSNQKGAQNAWYKCFSDNGVESYIPKANNNYRVNVRAVRKVKWPLK